jgi:hypothetical protein
MAHVTIGLLTYDASEEADLDLFIALYRGHLNALNINPLDLVANPSGASRAMGILRGCLQGRAAEFFDRELAGKRWEVQYILKNGTAVLNVFQNRVVPEGVGGPNAGTYVNPSLARAYSQVAGNALHTIGEAFIPTGLRFMDNEAWERSGGRPTPNPANILRNNVAGNGQPIVFSEITPDMALYWMYKNLPTLVEERRRLRFGNLEQDDLPVRDYWYKVQNASKMLNFPDPVRDNQFFRGLSAENVIEAERAGMERPVDELVNILERIERRKAEARLGRYIKKDRDEVQARNIIEPIQKPPVTQQEPVTIKPVTSHAVTQDMLNQLLQKHTENITKNFQAQLQVLQENVAQPPAKVPPPLPSKSTENMQRYYEGAYPFDDTLNERDRQHLFDLVDSPKVVKIAQRVARKLAQAEERRQDRELTRAMQGLNIDDNYPEPMDTSNLVRIGEVELDVDDLNIYIANLIRSQKKR